MSTSWQHFTYALTGSLGSGKTSAAKLFRELGALTISADELAQRVVAPGSSGLEQIVAKFGKEVVLPTGALDRRKLAGIVFSDSKKRKELEAITHPLIGKLAQEEFTRQNGERYPLALYDVPLYFEAGLDTRGFKGAIVVAAPQELALQRVLQRGGMTVAEAEKRFSSQLPLSEKVARADYVLDNSGDLAALAAQVKSLFSKLAR